MSTTTYDLSCMPCCGGGGVTSPCCPGVTVPTTLYVHLSNGTGTAACADGVVIGIVWDATRINSFGDQGGWFADAVPFCQGGSDVQLCCNKITNVWWIFGQGSIAFNTGGCAWAGPLSGTCSPFDMSMTGVTEDCGSTGSNTGDITTTVTAAP